MFERFTDRSRKVMGLAYRQALLYQNEHIDTEHILLGLLIDGSGAAIKALQQLSCDLTFIRSETERLIVRGSGSPGGKLPPAPHAVKVVEYALEEARNRNHKHIGTEHFLLGLLRLPDTIACQALNNAGATLPRTREAMATLFDS